MVIQNLNLKPQLGARACIWNNARQWFSISELFQKVQHRRQYASVAKALALCLLASLLPSWLLWPVVGRLPRRGYNCLGFTVTRHSRRIKR